MQPAEVQQLLEQELTGATVTVTAARHPGDEDHLAITVTSSRFEGMSLVDRHQLVYDVLEEHLMSDIHAIEVRTYTPEEMDEA